MKSGSMRSHKYFSPLVAAFRLSSGSSDRLDHSSTIRSEKDDGEYSKMQPFSQFVMY
jgi:hypothetical protein